MLPLIGTLEEWA